MPRESPPGEIDGGNRRRKARQGREIVYLQKQAKPPRVIAVAVAAAAAGGRGRGRKAVAGRGDLARYRPSSSSVAPSIFVVSIWAKRESHGEKGQTRS
ncbi:hypothetical protein ACJRO7_023515 [Eucalyptus globulus]|uniref:Uncharacterized protein n=1 Tax=Eucalyptus globulus TaxID=34317 RepID=A0ABD3K267_EUCGL